MQIELKSYKIRLKLFIIKYINTQNNPGLKNDVIDLIQLLMTKYNIEFNKDIHESFPLLFQQIYKENLQKQKEILRDINFYISDYK